MYIDYHYGGFPGRPAGPAATRPIGLTDACMNDDNNNNNNVAHVLRSGSTAKVQTSNTIKCWL